MLKKKSHSEPEFLVQKEIEEQLNQSYNKCLLAQTVNVLKEVDKSLKENDANVKPQ